MVAAPQFSRRAGDRKLWVMPRPIAWLGAVLALLAGLCAAAIFYWTSLGQAGSIPREQFWQALSWRIELGARKVRGDVPELSWAELWQMTRIRGGFGLKAFVAGAQSLEGSVANPYVSAGDREAGARTFRQVCAACHGGDASGWHAPALNRSGLKHGDSDLALYKVVRDGVSGSSMTSPQLEWSERWQVVGYIRTLQINGHAHSYPEGKELDVDVSRDKLRVAGKGDDQWTTYSGTLDGSRYTPLAQITSANVSKLRLRWIKQFDTEETRIEATPLVVDGVVFVTEPPSNVIALDAKSGRQIWAYNRSIAGDLRVCCGRVNRGLAILGHLVFLGSIDGYLVAIDANTGRMVWETKVGDAAEGYALTGAPLVVDGSVVVGIAGGEYGIRGYLAAYDAQTGRERWKFFTVPGPGEPGHQTWGNDAWRTGGGATWNTGSYDPSLDLIYWGVGNPSPDFSRGARPGDDLFTNSVIALHAKTGKLAWYFQFTPNDDHDWDSTQTPILADIPINGTIRRTICWANRNGFYYVLDRVTGKFLTGTPFVELDWASGLDSAGRPILVEAALPSGAGRLTRPGVAGATNWQNAAFDHGRGLVFVPATEGASVFTQALHLERKDRGAYLASAGSLLEPITAVVRALDVATGKRRWERSVPASTHSLPSYSGLLATGGGLVFGASAGHAFALDSASGRELWRMPLGGETFAAPISFTVDHHQVIAVSAGRALFVFGL